MFRDIDVSAYLKEVSVPVWICMGKEDFQVAPYYTWDSILEDFPKIQRTVMDECSHLPFLEKPEEFLTQFQNWIQ